jgi:hypothetical protein
VKSGRTTQTDPAAADTTEEIEPTDTDGSEELGRIVEVDAVAALSLSILSIRMRPGAAAIVVVELEECAAESGTSPIAISVYVSPGSGMLLALTPDVASVHWIMYHEAG